MKPTIKPAIIAASILAFAATAAAAENTWRIQSVGDAAAVGEPQIIFFEDGRIVGITGCNVIQGQAAMADGRLTLQSPLVSTKMLCPDDLDRQERAIAATLESGPEIAFDPFSNGLSVVGSDDAPTLVLSAED